MKLYLGQTIFNFKRQNFILYFQRESAKAKPDLIELHQRFEKHMQSVKPSSDRSKSSHYSQMKLFQFIHYITK